MVCERAREGLGAVPCVWDWILSLSQFSVCFSVSASVCLSKGSLSRALQQAELVPYTALPPSTIPETFLSFNSDFNKNISVSDAWSNASVTWTFDLQ
eukprot:739473-Rhodomonas_salina.2